MAHRPISPIELVYAKWIVSLSAERRLKFYEKLSSLLRNKFSLVDSLEKLYLVESDDSKNPSEPMAIAIRMWLNLLENGISFSVALRGWAPDRERLMLSVGDISSMEDALLNVIKVSQGSAKILGPLVSSLAYPTFLFCLTFIIIALVGIKLVPPLVEAAPDIVWQGVAASLVSLSGFVKSFWYFFPVAIIIFILFVLYSFPNLRGPVRVILDRFPPWSMYRLFTGIGWLLALSALIRTGTPVIQALRILRADSTPYLLERTEKTIAYINNGDNLGAALYHTGFNFPDRDIITDLRIYSELDQFEAALSNLANDWLDKSIQKLNEQANILNALAIMLVSTTIAWVVYGTFEMQNQVTANF